MRLIPFKYKSSNSTVFKFGHAEGVQLMRCMIPEMKHGIVVGAQFPLLRFKLPT